jgi:hypothetical protein
MEYALEQARKSSPATKFGGGAVLVDADILSTGSSLKLPDKNPGKTHADVRRSTIFLRADFANYYHRIQSFIQLLSHAIRG